MDDDLGWLWLPLPVKWILADAGYGSREALAGATDEQLLEIEGIGPGYVARIRECLAVKDGQTTQVV